jgi:hypothetical protein
MSSCHPDSLHCKALKRAKSLGEFIKDGVIGNYFQNTFLFVCVSMATRMSLYSWPATNKVLLLIICN